MENQYIEVDHMAQIVPSSVCDNEVTLTPKPTDLHLLVQSLTSPQELCYIHDCVSM